MGELNCKGSIKLGTACRKCPRCLRALARPGNSELLPLDRFRVEMIEDRNNMADVAKKYFDLGAYQSAALCALEVEVYDRVIKRIPQEW